jgi:beta-lactamase regulating signal transducer with metallopeptidase domain
VAQAEAEYAKELLNKLKYNKNDQLAEKLLEYANEQQKIRLKELRATRRAEDLEEQNKYKN